MSIGTASGSTGTTARPFRDASFLGLAATCAAIAFVGFAPTYWVPMIGGRLQVAPIFHLHATVFFAWSVFLVVQTWLATSRRIARHRAMGLAGVSLATAMVIFGFLIAIHQMHAAAVQGYAEAGRAFAIVPLGGIAFFAATFLAAVANVSRPDWHKRLMLVAAISILDAPIARWFMVLAPPPAGASGPPPVVLDAGPAAVTVVLLGLAMLLDRRQNGRVHRAYAIGVAALVIWKLVQVPISATPIWHSVAGRIMGLVG